MRRNKPTPKGQDFTSTQTEVIASPKIIRSALETVRSKDFPPITTNDILLVMESLTIKQVPHTEVISIAYRDADKEYATKFVQAIIDRYRLYLKEDQAVTHQAAPPREDLVRLQQELFKAQAQQTSISQQFGPKHPELRTAGPSSRVATAAGAQECRDRRLAGCRV